MPGEIHHLGAPGQGTWGTKECGDRGCERNPPGALGVVVRSLSHQRVLPCWNYKPELIQWIFSKGQKSVKSTSNI